MPYLLNLFYLLALFLLSPWLVYKACTTGKYRRGLLAKFFGLAPLRNTDRPCVWFHGVSVGEVHLLRQVVTAFRKRYPQFEVIISTTTDTGLEEARKHFPDLTVFYWPLDFTWSAGRALSRIKPSLVVLAESELWPNFLWSAKKLGAKVAIINGRMSPRTMRRYERFGFLARWMFRKVDLWSMQTQEYADAVRAFIDDSQKTSKTTIDQLNRNGSVLIHVTGSVKYDGVEVNRNNPKTQALRELFAIQSNDLIWIAGSTQAPEEEIALNIFTQIRKRFGALRLILVPRQRERFAEVADLLERSRLPFVRRCQLIQPVQRHSAIILVDTIGELGAIWGLANVAFVGGSLDGRRGGQNMIEPAAYGAAVLFGPHVWNFKEPVARLLDSKAAIQVADAVELEEQLVRVFQDEMLRQRMGLAAQQFVQAQQGATEETVRLLGELLELTAIKMSAA